MIIKSFRGISSSNLYIYVFCSFGQPFSGFENPQKTKKQKLNDIMKIHTYVKRKPTYKKKKNEIDSRAQTHAHTHARTPLRARAHDATENFFRLVTLTHSPFLTFSPPLSIFSPHPAPFIFPLLFHFSPFHRLLFVYLKKPLFRR